MSDSWCAKCAGLEEQLRMLMIERNDLQRRLVEESERANAFFLGLGKDSAEPVALPTRYVVADRLVNFTDRRFHRVLNLAKAVAFRLRRS